MTDFIKLFEEQLAQTPFLTQTSFDGMLENRKNNSCWGEAELKAFEEEIRPKINKEKQLYFMEYVSLDDGTGKITLEVKSFWSSDIDKIEQEYDLVEKVTTLPKLKKKKDVYTGDKEL